MDTHVTCGAVTKKHEPCTNPARPGKFTCGVHARYEQSVGARRRAARAQTLKRSGR